MADWNAIEDALSTVLASGAGDDNGDIATYFENQGGDQPNQDYLGISLTGVMPVGQPYHWKNYSAARSPGVEMEVQAVNDLEVHASIQAYTDSSYGTSSARQRLSKLRLSLSLPSQRLILKAAGIALFDIQDVQDIPRLLDTDWQGRAQLNLRFYVRDTLSEFTTWIEHVAKPQLVIEE